ncbi:MAG: 3-phosphoglycerate dehydrogenase [Oscillospiraceae bacterium]|jgi:D-3-phosphoglycerate dehydrogenase|nr:3-phosphoglycerate dehydrogenase [Oscillospiraceae bacterium]
MFKIKLYNKIAKVGLDRLDPAKFVYGEEIELPDAIIVRSAKITPEHLTPGLKCIVRAGAGVNNICVDECRERGIAVFNTPGANANAVKELAIAALILASRDIVGGIAWTRANASDSDVPTLVEKGKAQFTGPEIIGKTLGLIGTGAVGALVARAANALGMRVLAADPFLSEGARTALSDCVTFVDDGKVKLGDFTEVFAQSDYISLHAPVTADTRGGVNSSTIAKMRDGVRIVNLARAELVDDDALLAALASGKVARYVTDLPTNKTADAAGVIAIPHLGSSTPESEDNCAIMAADTVTNYFINNATTGNIR